jgi:hypothetical protein
LVHRKNQDFHEKDTITNINKSKEIINDVIIFHVIMMILLQIFPIVKVKVYSKPPIDRGDDFRMGAFRVYGLWLGEKLPAWQLGNA